MQEWTLCAACRSSVHPYRTAAIAPAQYSPPLGWTGLATSLLLAAILMPVISTVGMLAALKNCDGVAVPRWDEAAVMIGASLALAWLGVRAHAFVRRRLSRVRTRRAFTSGAWSVVGILPGLAALGAVSLVALHFSMEHLFDTLCIDLRGLFWHGC